jgi:hypothetical protein
MRIYHHIAPANLGDTDNAGAQQYVAALTNALATEYPGADVRVDLKSDFANDDQTVVTGAPSTGPDDDESAISENVHIVANRVWERM